MAGKSNGKVLQWQKALTEELAALDTIPNHSSIVAVGAVLVTHADPDGSNCRPGSRRVSRLAGLHTSTVNAAIKWMHDEGWLEFVGRLNPYAPNEYRLQIPVRASSAHDTEPDVRAPSAHDDEHRARMSRASCAGLCAGPCADHPRKPPTSAQEVEEEDAERVSADADTPSAGSTNGRPDKATIRRVVDSVPAKYRTATDWQNIDLLAEIARLSEWTDRQFAVAVSTGWPENVGRPTGVLLKRLRSLPTDPEDYAPGFGIVSHSVAGFDPDEHFSPWAEDLTRHPAPAQERLVKDALRILGTKDDWFAKQLECDDENSVEYLARQVIVHLLMKAPGYDRLYELSENDPDRILDDADERFDALTDRPPWLDIAYEEIVAYGWAEDDVPLGRRASMIARFAVAVELAEAVQR